ncbi:unannotated protein [freshwater metagenome]|uniref:Unannotated protein n=1 Tax=freshwater metagenome TaxID=449393 RepID=A0A6J7UHU6_9ZZZZ
MIAGYATRITRSQGLAPRQKNTPISTVNAMCSEGIAATRFTKFWPLFHSRSA